MAEEIKTEDGDVWKAKWCSRFGEHRLPQLRDASQNQPAACKIDACPRKISAESIRRFPSSCTSPNESAPLPAAITSSFSRCKNFPGFPSRSTIAAEKIFNFRGSGKAISANAPGHGLKAQIFRSIISAGSDQSI